MSNLMKSRSEENENYNKAIVCVNELINEIKKLSGSNLENFKQNKIKINNIEQITNIEQWIDLKESIIEDLNEYESNVRLK